MTAEDYDSQFAQSISSAKAEGNALYTNYKINESHMKV